MGYYIIIPLTFLIATLQASIFPLLRFGSAQPDLLLIFVLAWAFYASSLEESVFMAFIAGIGQDLVSVLPLGTSSIALLIMVFVIHGFRQQVYNINILMVLGFILGASLLHHIFVAVGLRFIGLGATAIDTIRYVILPTLLYNLVLTLPVYVIVRWIQRRYPTTER